MNSKSDFVNVSRIVLTIHRGLIQKAYESFKKLGFGHIMVEDSRTVRRHNSYGFLDAIGFGSNFIDSSSCIVRAVVPNEATEYVISTLISDLELRTPGRGSVYSQKITELGHRKLRELNIGETKSDRLLRELTLITGIQSKNSNCEEISKVALKIGAGVPTVGIGKGTGLRNRIGLLRITISQEKELTFLPVPSCDANGLQNMLVQKGKLNRHAGGFIYQTPIEMGLVDPLICIGSQEHAASLEQIINAIDEIKQSTDWRKRLFEGEEYANLPTKTSYTHKELSFICPLEHSDAYVQAAMDKGAPGATLTTMREIDLTGDNPVVANTYECAIICIQKSVEDKIIDAIIAKSEENKEEDWFIQMIDASSIYATYRRK